MSKKCYYIIVIAGFLFLQSCGVLFQRDKDLKEYQLHEEQYKPYKLQNTIEGYREFIALYPKNLFVKEAELQIENLEFSPYEHADSVEGYMEFKMRYPNNRHVFKADVKIEQVECKHYEKMDTIEGYEEFLSKYPESTFAVLAQERLQELEFRKLDNILRKKYGFDLLLYRLHLKRLKRKLTTVNGINLGDFTCFASIATHKGEKYFHTHLIYSTDLSYLDVTSKEVAERFFESIVSKALVFLDNHFMIKDGIDGFSFDVSSSAHSFYRDRKTLLEYYFPIRQVNLFAQNKLDKKDLLAQSIIVTPKELDWEARQVAQMKVTNMRDESLREEIVDVEKLDGSKIMTMVSERDSGEDYIISRSWERGRHTMRSIEKRKNLRGKDGFIDKSVIRYIDPPDYYGTTILTWNYKKSEKAFWFITFRGQFRDTARITNTEHIRPPAETDFSLIDYVEIDVGEERHELLRSEGFEGTQYSVIESTPIKKGMKYGKRISWIDQRYFIPRKIEYFDKRGELWKTLHIEWQNKFGLWFWKKAVGKDVQTGDKTFITIEDVRVNVGLHDRDFTRYGLIKQKHGF